MQHPQGVSLFLLIDSWLLAFSMLACSGDPSQYIRDCFGGSFTYNEFHDFFPDQLGITVLEEETMREVRKQHRKEFDEAVSQIAQWDLRRKDEKSKSDLRIESEAEAFIAVTHWNTIRDLMMAGTVSKCSYMT